MKFYAILKKKQYLFSENYDGSEMIPDVMPTKIPNLLVNGSSGIAVGMATNIPPHNLNEVINGSLALLENPKITIDSLIEHKVRLIFQRVGLLMGKWVYLRHIKPEEGLSIYSIKIED